MFFEEMDLHTTLDLKSNRMDSSPFENNLKRTINCPVTAVTYVTRQWGSYHENLFIVT